MDSFYFIYLFLLQFVKIFVKIYFYILDKLISKTNVCQTAKINYLK